MISSSQIMVEAKKGSTNSVHERGIECVVSFPRATSRCNCKQGKEEGFTMISSGKKKSAGRPSS
jgi:hypothetical protein